MDSHSQSYTHDSSYRSGAIVFFPPPPPPKELGHLDWPRLTRQRRPPTLGSTFGGLAQGYDSRNRHQGYQESQFNSLVSQYTTNWGMPYHMSSTGSTRFRPAAYSGLLEGFGHSPYARYPADPVFGADSRDEQVGFVISAVRLLLIIH
jgi:hypothetical protein